MSISLSNCKSSLENILKDRDYNLGFGKVDIEDIGDVWKCITVIEVGPCVWNSTREVREVEIASRYPSVRPRANKNAPDHETLCRKPTIPKWQMICCFVD